MTPGCQCLSMGQCWNGFGCFRKENYHRRHQLAGGKVQLVNKVETWEDKLSQAKRTGKILVVKFSATWCAPCKEIAAPYRQLADKYSSLVFLAVDVDQMAELCNSWDIKATPTFFFFREGRPFDRLVGANQRELQRKIAAIADSMDPVLI